MPVDLTPGIVAHAIQLAIAPVFLLTGIAGLLNVMATRLSRVIDRARSFEIDWPRLSAEQKAMALREIAMLERRRRACSWSINLCTAAALLICMVIAALFCEELLGVQLKWFTGVLFVVVMLALIGGLSCFLREVYLATQTISFDPHTLEALDRAS